MEHRLLITLLLTAGLAGSAGARRWTSNDGKTLEADFVSAQGDQVKLTRPNGQEFTLPLARLSETDQEFVKLQASAPAVKPIEGPFAKLVTGDWELGEAEGQQFAFYGSKTLSGEKKYPLVVSLHGRSKNSTNGKQVTDWMKSFTSEQNEKERPCFVLAPLSAQPEASEGYGWSGGEVERVVKLIKALVKGLPIDPKRIYLIGHSMGGFGTCNVMASEPRLFAAGIPVAGVSIGAVGEISRKPMWMFHAADDSVVPVAGAREFAELMKRNKEFKYIETATGGHGVATQVFNDPDTHKWLFSQALK